MKLLITLLIVFISGCVSSPKKHKSENLEGSCFVRWSNPEYKKMYKKGIGKSYEIKMMNNLLFPVWQNQGIYVFEKIDKTYLVKFDLSDKQGRKKVENIIKNNFFMGEVIDQELMLIMADQMWKINQDELSEMIEKYEKVDCRSYFSSQSM